MSITLREQYGVLKGPRLQIQGSTTLSFYLLFHNEPSLLSLQISILYHLAGHPHIIGVVDAFEDIRSVSIVMELCHGGELYDRLIAKGQYR